MHINTLFCSDKEFITLMRIANFKDSYFGIGFYQAL